MILNKFDDRELMLDKTADFYFFNYSFIVLYYGLAIIIHQPIANWAEASKMEFVKCFKWANPFMLEILQIKLSINIWDISISYTSIKMYYSNSITLFFADVDRDPYHDNRHTSLFGGPATFHNSVQSPPKRCFFQLNNGQ